MHRPIRGPLLPRPADREMGMEGRRLLEKNDEKRRASSKTTEKPKHQLGSKLHIC